ncbi:hypothetical protein AC739_03595 [Planococcus glaciei]|nr:hypothetical protein AC739_03595 [Planococcus glaciei]
MFALATFRFIPFTFLIKFSFIIKSERVGMLFIHCAPSIWSKPAETPAGKRDSRDPARRAAAEEAWRSPAASAAGLRNIEDTPRGIFLYLSQQANKKAAMKAAFSLFCKVVN